MVDIEKEGFIKVTPKKSELKNYLFYLTFNNRADFFFTEAEEKEEVFENPQKILFTKGILNLYYTYVKSTKKEMVGSRIKSIELIMSYSTDFNKLMIDIYGLEKWKNIYKNIINKLMKKYFEKNRNILNYVHTYDSQGLRIHNHTLIYPYKYNSEKKIYEKYTYIPDEELNLIKKEYNQISKQLIQKNFNKIKYLKREKKEKYEKYLRKIKI